MAKLLFPVIQTLIQVLLGSHFAREIEARGGELTLKRKTILDGLGRPNLLAEGLQSKADTFQREEILFERRNSQPTPTEFQPTYTLPFPAAWLVELRSLASPVTVNSF